MQTRTARAADSAVMTRLHLDHSGDLLHFLLRLTQERQTAEDLLQETMLRAWLRLETVPADREDARRWLFTVARNLVIDVVRARRIRPQVVHAVDVSWVAADDDTTAAALATHSVRSAFRNLSPAHRAVLTEVYLQGHSPAEVSARLGLPIGTVKSRAHYAMRALRSGIGD
jgi:RNA polymerase sigma-70 factor, ECF subfamily